MLHNWVGTKPFSKHYFPKKKILHDAQEDLPYRMLDLMVKIDFKKK